MKSKQVSKGDISGESSTIPTAVEVENLLPAEYISNSISKETQLDRKTNFMPSIEVVKRLQRIHNKTKKKKKTKNVQRRKRVMQKAGRVFNHKSKSNLTKKLRKIRVATKINRNKRKITKL